MTVAHDGLEGLMAIVRETPDLILCSINLPDMTGFEMLERLSELTPRFGRIPIVCVTRLASRDEELKCRQLGADDYVSTPIDFDRLAFIISARLAGVTRSALLGNFVELSSRENQVLTLAARGNTSIEIARRLRVSKRTIDFHIDNARKKLHAATRTEAVLKAASSGLIKL